MPTVTDRSEIHKTDPALGRNGSPSTWVRAEGANPPPSVQRPKPSKAPPKPSAGATTNTKDD